MQVSTIVTQGNHRVAMNVITVRIKENSWLEVVAETLVWNSAAGFEVKIESVAARTYFEWLNFIRIHWFAGFVVVEMQISSETSSRAIARKWF